MCRLLAKGMGNKKLKMVFHVKNDSKIEPFYHRGKIGSASALAWALQLTVPLKTNRIHFLMQKNQQGAFLAARK